MTLFLIIFDGIGHVQARKWRPWIQRGTGIKRWFADEHVTLLSFIITDGKKSNLMNESAAVVKRYIPIVIILLSMTKTCFRSCPFLLLLTTNLAYYFPAFERLQKWPRSERGNGIPDILHPSQETRSIILKSIVMKSSFVGGRILLNCFKEHKRGETDQGYQLGLRH